MTVPPPGSPDGSPAEPTGARADGGYGLISGRYRLGELLGSGGSASVFQAVDVATGERVALKILHPHLSRSTAAREAFFVEARAAERLLHPNIVRVLGVGVHRLGGHPAGPSDGGAPRNGDPHGRSGSHRGDEPGEVADGADGDDSAGEPRAWIALELAPGVTLAEEVERLGRLPVTEALAVADGVLTALEYAHDAGLIHRDVSPANVMLARDPRGRLRPSGVRLLDFGLADAAGRAAVGADVLRTPGATAPAGVLGNANYVSPEQARGLPVDERGDVYQLGATLYFALVGRPPFVRDSVVATLAAHQDAPPPVPSVARPGVLRAVDRIVVKSLLKDPALRFSSAAEMAVAVRAAAARAAAADGGRVPPVGGAPAHPGSGGAGGDAATVVFGAAAVSATGSFAAGRGTATSSGAPVSTADAVTTALPTARSRRGAAPGGASGAGGMPPGASATGTRPPTGQRPATGRRAGAGQGSGLGAHTGFGAGAGSAPTGLGSGSAPGSAGPSGPAGTASAAALPRHGALALWLVAGLVLVLLVTAWSLTATGAGPAPFAAPTASAQPSAAPAPTTAAPPVQPVSVPLRAVPALVNGTLDAAQAALSAAGLALGAVAQESSAHPAGTVLQADPAEGSQLAEGTAVNLVVASGSNVVPELAGSDQSAAVQRLRDSGFSATTSTAPSATSAAGQAPPGTVLAITPAAGTVLPLGSTVALVIAPAPAATPTPVATPSPTPASTPPPTTTPSPTTDPTPPPNAG
ncbi:serine/threonine-protein kinase [Herbiconiux liangxiaofengii]|uniref:serine/threonine-protein kinase n=1 Tax=Herbiconiux liangxiaofengii TaxID=3342795 RepID=UPI0035B85257